MKVALIIGHSETSQGAVNKSNKVSEFQFNEPLAFGIAQQLNDRGFEALVVYRDCSYKQLPSKVNRTGADIAISLHCNAFNGGAHGTETLYYKGSLKGRRLAQCLQTEIVDCLQLPDRGIKEKKAGHKGKTGDRGGVLLKYTSMPCVIAEPFFIDSDDSLALAVHKFDGLVNAYANGIQAYLEDL